MARRLPSQRYDSRYGMCRDLGHPWGIEQWRGNHRTCVCDGCGTHREERFDGDWRVVWRKYKYPPNYAWVGTKFEVRLIRAQLKRDARKLTRWVGAPKLKLVEGGKQ